MRCSRAGGGHRRRATALWHLAASRDEFALHSTSLRTRGGSDRPAWRQSSSDNSGCLRSFRATTHVALARMTPPTSASQLVAHCVSLLCHRSCAAMPRLKVTPKRCEIPPPARMPILAPDSQLVPLPPGSMLLIQQPHAGQQQYGGFGLAEPHWHAPSHAFLTGSSIDPSHVYHAAAAASAFTPSYTLSVPWTASATHAAPSSALEAASLRKLEAAKDAARQVRASKLAAKAAAQKRAAATASSAAATSAVATSAAAGGKKRKGDSSAADSSAAASSTSKKSKTAAAATAAAAAAGAPPPIDAEELQFEVEYLLGKRVRLMPTQTIRRMKGTEDAVTGRNALEVCQRDLEDLMEEEMAIKRGGVQGLTAASGPAAAASSSVSSRNATASAFFPYSSLDPLVQLPFVEYLIRWKGYSSSSDSWEPKWNIHAAMIAEFETRVNELTRRPRHQLDSTALAMLASMSIKHPAITEIASAKAVAASKSKSKGAPAASGKKTTKAAPAKIAAAAVATTPSAPKGSRSRPAPMKP